MKGLLLLAVSGGLAVHVLSAAPVCIADSLANYELLGAGGCMIGANTVALFGPVGGTTGATPIPASAITVTPLGGSSNPGLMFQTTQSANANALLEAIFTYIVSGSRYTSDMLTLSGSSETADGAVTDIQNYCADGTFGPDGVTGCTGSATGALVGLDGIQNTDQTPLATPQLLSVTDDFTLDGGTGGTASGGTFVDQFTALSAVPEPGAFLLSGLGLALISFRSRRQTSH